MIQRTVALTASDIAIIFEAIQRTAKLQLSDFVDLVEIKPVTKPVLEWAKEIGDTVTDKKALALSRKRRNAAKKRTAEEAQTLVDKDRTNDFGLWYSNIKDKADKYFNDIVSGKATDVLKEPGKLAPWEKEETLYQEIGKQLSEDASTETIMSQRLPEIERLQRSAVNMKIRALLLRLKVGAYYTAMHRHFVDTKKMTKSAFCAALGRDPTTINKYREVYTFIKEYNLFIYTSETFTTLSKWLAPLKQYLSRYPQSALYWQGHGLIYTQQRLVPPQFNQDNQFQVAGQVYPYSQQNIEQRTINQDRALNEELTGPMEGIDLDDLDDVPDVVLFGKT